ncbi:hypothetical protein FACS18945_2580 [Bacteroidia bacterium]|nr:hypothetical protein FACS189434_12850 [Bacteroidia bacterium]GHT57694.1 hypothetical protein FACS18945_2580 [Bacteroidia bacterium]
MKKITLKAWAILLLSLLGFASANAADKVLPLDGVNLISDGGRVTYTNPTITYGSYGEENVWQYAGWEWATGEDFSAYNAVIAEFDASGLPDVGDPAKIQVQVTYLDGSNTQVEVRKTNTVAVITLNAEKKSAVKEVFLKSQYGGSITLGKVYATNVKNSDLPLYGMNNFDGGSYDVATKTLSVTSGYGRGSWVNLNKDVTAYSALVIEYDLASLTAGKVQLIVKADGVEVVDEPDPATGVLTVSLEGKTNLTEIHLKLQEAGASVVLQRAYFTPEDADPAVDPRTLVDIPSGFTGDVQVLFVDGVGLGGHNAGVVSNANGYAELSDVEGEDFICAAGGRPFAISNPQQFGQEDVDNTYKYVTVKVRLAAGKSYNPDWAFGIATEVWNSAAKKKWSEWTTDGESVPAPTAEWQNIVFEIDPALLTDWAWLRVGLERWVGGFLEIEDIWVTKTNPFAAGAIDYTALQAKVTEIGTAFVALANGSTNPTDIQNALTAKYTLASLATFQPKYTAAQNLLANGAEDQEEVNSILALLNSAYAGLVEKETGIYDTAADGATVTGYYSILGAKLSQEPASGVFIVKYSNGKSVKVVK